MPEIKVYFADGTVETFHEEQSFMSIKSSLSSNEIPEKLYPSQSGVYSLWNHTHDGLVPSLLELLANSDYFFDIENPQNYYNSNSIVRIEK
ncbi:hypothetical protein ACYSNU_07365 [Enterococcus sp. LJL120]